MKRTVSLKNVLLLRPQAALCGLLVLLTGSLINLTLIGSTLWRLNTLHSCQQSQKQSSPADPGLETPNGPAGTGP